MVWPFRWSIGLARIYFADLSEAIKPWLKGAINTAKADAILGCRMGTSGAITRLLLPKVGSRG
jgi:hypothetical protein